MSDLHEFFKSDENCGDYYSPTPSPTKLIDKQSTSLGKEARTGDIVDRTEVIIKCSNCGAELATIKVTRPKAKIKSFIVAECCHCGDKSFKKEFFGGFLVGGTNKTSVVGYPMETNTDGEYFVQNIIIKTKKYKG